MRKTWGKCSTCLCYVQNIFGIGFCDSNKNKRLNKFKKEILKTEKNSTCYYYTPLSLS